MAGTPCGVCGRETVRGDARVPSGLERFRIAVFACPSCGHERWVYWLAADIDNESDRAALLGHLYRTLALTEAEEAAHDAQAPTSSV